MTGFRSAPVDPRVLTELQNKNISFKSFPLNKIKVRNITLFSDYDININEPQNIVLSGISSVYDSTYSGNLYAKITGIAEFIDIGVTNNSGIYNPSGFHTGIFINGQTFYDRKNRQVYPVNENLTISSSSNVKYLASGKITGQDLNPNDFKLRSTTGIINIPITLRNNLYSGLYTGIKTLQENFYDPDTFTVSFYKEYSYRTTGNNYWNTNFDIVNSTTSAPGEVAGTFVLNKVMNAGSGYVNQIKTIISSGNIQKVKLPRKNLIGRAVLTGFLTGTVSPENFGIGGVGSGFKNFLKLITGSGINAIQDYATGYSNAFNFLNYNTPEEFDFITIEDPVNDILSTFTYATGSLFNPPLYFDSITTLNNIINSGNGSYGVYSQIVGSKLKLTSATSGESGNLIFIQTFGSSNTPTLENGNYLLSGQSHYEPLVSTGVFYSFAKGTVLATGVMTANYSNYITGNITGILGDKKFLDTWNIYTSDNSISYTYLNDYTSLTSNTGINYTTNYIDESANYLYNINVLYNNINNNIYDDIAQLKITLNNEQQIIINLTGV
jgi:hypothetical protein